MEGAHLVVDPTLVVFANRAQLPAAGMRRRGNFSGVCIGVEEALRYARVHGASRIFESSQSHDKETQHELDSKL